MKPNLADELVKNVSTSLKSQTKTLRTRPIARKPEPILKKPFELGDYKKIIRDLGLKVTDQRLKILECILNGRDHMNAQEVFEAVIEKSPEIGFATVYRFLRTLSEQHYVIEVRMKAGPARYEWAWKTHHDHLTCTECGCICEFENTEIENLQKKIAEHFGFELTDHLLELYGRCPDCRVKPFQLGNA